MIDKAYDIITTYNVDGLLKKINDLLYIMPIPSNYESHNLDTWFELEEDECIHWKLPTKEQLTHILMDMMIQCLYSNNDVEFGDIKIIYNDGNPIIDESWFDAELKDLKSFYEAYEYDKKYILPQQKYKGNCSKEFCDIIVEKFWEREYERIQYIDFPPLSFIQPTLKKCENEFKNLQKNPGELKTKYSSNLVTYFHQSIILANIKGNISPYEGWKLIQNDPEVFKSFYRNRLRYSDWFKGQGRLIYFLRGVFMENSYGTGLSSSRMFPHVTYFKPKLAKYIIEKYLNKFNTIFDPFSGYSGRMIGCLASNKNYVGQDLCEYSVDESNEIYEFLSKYTSNSAVISKKDSTKETGKYECLFTCSPYEDLEEWPGVNTLNYSCDKWIDICLKNYDCERYVFVTDDKLNKYKKYIKEEIVNTSHFKKNSEYIIVIDKNKL